MALILQALGLEAKDQGVSESAWIVQIAGTIIFQKKIHSWKTPIMRSVQSPQKNAKYDFDFISAETIKEFDSHAMKDTEKAKESPPKEIVSEGQCYFKLHMHNSYY